MILQKPFLANDIRERQPNMTLALIGGVVYRDHNRLSSDPLPGEHEEAVVSPVTVPGRSTCKQLPLAIANGRLAQHEKKTVIKLLHRLIDRFNRATYEMGRDSLLTTLELPLVDETQPWSEKRDYSCGLMNVGSERRSRPRFVVILQESGQFGLVIESRVKMLADRLGMPFSQAIVEPFVVGVVESLLL